MAQFEKFIDHVKNLPVARVKLLGSVSLVAMPVGWLLTMLGFEYRILEFTGVFIGIIGFSAALIILPTSIQRVAGGLEQGLDEFELSVRLKAQSLAYQVLSGIMLFLLFVGMIVPEIFYNMPPNSNAFRILFAWSVAYYFVLPPWLMAQRLPTPQSGDDQ